MSELKVTIDRRHRLRAVRQAQAWLEQDPLFLDTETTGQGITSEICEIGIVSLKGAVFQSLVRPVGVMGKEAQAVHGITDEELTKSPYFADLVSIIQPLLVRRFVITYSADFDWRMFSQSLLAAELHDMSREMSGSPKWHCALRLYAEYYGAWIEQYQSFTFQSLGKALEQCELSASSSPAHRAIGDVENTRAVVQYMAEHP